MHPPFERGSESVTRTATPNEANGHRANAVQEGRSRVEVTESELITLMALVREYSDDKNLYVKLAEARP